MALITEPPADIPTTNALDGIEEPRQGVIIDAAYVRFAGTSTGSLDDPPELEESRIYIVKATCVGIDRRLRKDSEERVTVVMEIDWLHEKGKAPVLEDNQQPLFTEDGQPYIDNDGSDDSSGDGADGGNDGGDGE